MSEVNSIKLEKELRLRDVVIRVRKYMGNGKWWDEKIWTILLEESLWKMDVMNN
jgi:hypothetical protein